MTVTRRALLAGSAAVVVSVAVPRVPLAGTFCLNRDAIWDGLRWVPMTEIIERRMDQALAIAKSAIIDNLYHDSHQPVIGNHERNHLD